MIDIEVRDIITDGHGTIVWTLLPGILASHWSTANCAISSWRMGGMCLTDWDDGLIHCLLALPLVIADAFCVMKSLVNQVGQSY